MALWAARSDNPLDPLGAAVPPSSRPSRSETPTPDRPPVTTSRPAVTSGRLQEGYVRVGGAALLYRLEVAECRGPAGRLLFCPRPHRHALVSAPRRSDRTASVSAGVLPVVAPETSTRLHHLPLEPDLDVAGATPWGDSGSASRSISRALARRTRCGRSAPRCWPVQRSRGLRLDRLDHERWAAARGGVEREQRHPSSRLQPAAVVSAGAAPSRERCYRAVPVTVVPSGPRPRADGPSSHAEAASALLAWHFRRTRERRPLHPRRDSAPRRGVRRSPGPRARRGSVALRLTVVLAYAQSQGGMHRQGGLSPDLRLADHLAQLEARAARGSLALSCRGVARVRRRGGVPDVAALPRRLARSAGRSGDRVTTRLNVEEPNCERASWSPMAQSTQQAGRPSRSMNRRGGSRPRDQPPMRAHRRPARRPAAATVPYALPSPRPTRPSAVRSGVANAPPVRPMPCLPCRRSGSRWRRRRSPRTSRSSSPTRPALPPPSGR